MLNFDWYEIKTRAWNMLKSCYWYALLAFFVSYILTSVVSGLVQIITQVFSTVFGVVFATKINELETWLSGIKVDQFESVIRSMSMEEILNIVMPVMIGWGMIMLVATVLGFIISVFANEQIAIGLRSSYLSMRLGNKNLDGIISGFSKNYFNVVKVAAVKWVHVMIGSILFIIPGIILNYRYMMVPFLLAENPNMSTQRALEISRAMMKGNKFRMFVMQLTFIGWFFLGMFACGIGVMFVCPYYIMAETEAYCELRAQAIANGIVQAEELSVVQVI